MKNLNRISLIAVLGSALLLSACGGDSHIASSPETPTGPGGTGVATLPPPGPAVPGAVGNSISSFITYLAGLSTVDERAEPSPIADNFMVPDNETSNPQVLS